MQHRQAFTVEKKRLIVDSYAKWKIADVETYYKATGGVERVAENRLARRVNDGLRNQFGTRTLREVVSGERDFDAKHHRRFEQYCVSRAGNTGCGC